MTRRRRGDRRAQGIVPDGPPLAQVFKTVHAGHTGKLSYARIWRGAIKDGATLGGTRLGGIYHFAGGELAKCAEAGEGDIVAFGRLEAWRPGRRCRPVQRRSNCRSRRLRRRSIRWRSPRPDHKDDVKLNGALTSCARKTRRCR